jgi:hypothetical protein
LPQKVYAMFLKKLSDDVRYTIIIVVTLLTVPLVFYFFDRFAGSGTSSKPESKEMTVIVTEAEKKEILTKIPPKSLVNNIRDAIKQGNHSTAYMQLRKMPKDSPEYNELSKLLAEEGKNHQRPGIRKESSTPESPVRYLDESTPRDRSTDALYLYLIDVSGGIWPRFCIQSVGRRAIGINGFRIKADGKTFAIRPSAIKTEKFPDKVCEYFDAPLDQLSYAAVKALASARKSAITVIGSGGERERIITEAEKNGLRRILETYTALGGQLGLFQAAETGKGKTSRHSGLLLITPNRHPAASFEACLKTRFTRKGPVSGILCIGTNIASHFHT